MRSFMGISCQFILILYEDGGNKLGNIIFIALKNDICQIQIRSL